MGYENVPLDDDHQPDIFTNSKSNKPKNQDANHLLGFSYKEEQEEKIGMSSY